ncbi:kinase-like protein [Bimuria novae-zelandiae CBS 107.79]|uniref:Kinase-like protein n=1 Tax=Bimuria novae-zelandiae CBS 107.79 TaxID=1447943 RepID=A0A6A5UJ92_9PLEO|nr:kinase-like protein [Bimuria novae-zelandiae CBS 107.79]
MGSEESLFQRLKRKQSTCSLNNNSQQMFLPLNIMRQEITEDNVRGALTKDTGLTATLKLLHLLPEDTLPQRVVDYATKVFTVLVIIGEPDAIRKILDEGLTDEHLPLRLAENEITLISHDEVEFRSFSETMSEQRISEFVEKQWTVLAPILDASGEHTDLDRRCPLPFEHTKQAGHGASRLVHKSKLHPSHYSGPESLANLEYVATKEFWVEADFLKERENLRTVASLNHKHLITHLATFTKGTTHYVIFPWADGGSLREFWTREDAQPRDRQLFTWSLRQLLGVAEAIEALHGINCRHGDMKPENILHFSGPDGGRLVVADVGVSRSHDHATKLRHAGTTTRATTPSYEAPEAFTHSYVPRARRYDVWSIGCIFLEFALWLLHDLETIISFGYARHAPDFEFYLINRDSSDSNRRTEIHPMVTKALKRLRQDPRCKDGTLFDDFLDLIENHLLLVEVNQRAEADELVGRLRNIVQEAEADPTRLLNDVTSPPEKLRFPRRTQTGAIEPVNGPIPENRAI